MVADKGEILLRQRVIRSYWWPAFNLMQDVLRLENDFPIGQTKQKVELFLEWVAVDRTHAPRAYKLWIYRFFNVVGKPTEECDTPEIAAYKRWLETKYKPKTQQLAIVAIKQYFKFCKMKGVKCMDSGLIRVPRFQAPAQPFLDKEEYEHILKFCKRNSFRDIQAELVLRLLWETNVRVSELCAIDIEHLELKERTVIVLNRKARVEADTVKIVAWSKVTHELLLSYLDLRLAATGGIALFVGIEAGDEGYTNRATTRTVQRIVRRLADRAGVKKRLSPHQLRRGHAHHLLAQGLALSFVSDYLGHRSWESTRPYLRSTNKELLTAVREKLDAE